MSAPEDELATRLRGRARAFNDALDDHRRARRFQGERIIAEIPSGPGVALRVGWEDGERRFGSAFFQIIRVGVDGERVSMSGAIRINAGALPGLADAIVRALEIARVQFLREPTDGGTRPSRPDEVREPAGSTPQKHHDGGDGGWGELAFAGTPHG